MRTWVLPEYIEDILPPEAARIERLRRAHPRSLPCARLRAGDAAVARIPGVAADRHRARPRSADLQAGGPALGPHAGRACRYHAAGRAHRCASAEPQGRHAAVLYRQRAAHAALRHEPHTRAAADRRRNLRPRRHRERRRDPAPHDERAGDSASMRDACLDIGHVGDVPRTGRARQIVAEGLESDLFRRDAGEGRAVAARAYAPARPRLARGA